MVGGGIFAVLGLAVLLAGGATWLSFVVAGLVAVLTAYSYAKLSVAYPSQGGTIVFIDKAFGVDLYTGTINNLLWLGYVVTLALYAVAFGNYAATFLPADQQSETTFHLLVSLAIIVPTLLNFFGAEIISKAETYIVAVKVAILILVIILGFSSVDAARLEPSTWQPLMQIVSAGMIIFVAYEGFELIANTAPVVRNYRTTLPRAYYIAVVFVLILYALIAVVVVGSLPASEIASAQDFALAEAAKPSLGQFGFTLVAV
ncbi:MAG: amino acid permease, partial [Anaerolineae bacterium]|nr:amino acid permease [Anaerolineae bacterium]